MSDAVARFQQMTPVEQLQAISSNLRRIGSWAYEYPNEARVKNIERFLEETGEFTKLVEIKKSTPSRRFKKFRLEFPKLKMEWETSWDNHLHRLRWAEKILTWSNLLD